MENLEYCPAEKCIEREQYYLDLLHPEYNVLKKAGSLLGFKHSDKTISNLKNRIWTLEDKAKRLAHLKIWHSDPELKVKRLEGLKKYHASPEHKEQLKRLNSSFEQKERLKRLHSSLEHKEHLKRLNLDKSHPVSVFDSLTNETKSYPSIREAARAIDVSESNIRSAFKRKNAPSILIKKKRYEITKLSN